MDKLERNVALSFQLVKNDLMKMQHDIALLAENEKIASVAHIEVQKLKDKVAAQKIDVSNLTSTLEKLQSTLSDVKGDNNKLKKMVVDMKKKAAKDLATLKKKHTKDMADLKKRIVTVKKVARKIVTKKTTAKKTRKRVAKKK